MFWLQLLWVKKFGKLSADPLHERGRRVPSRLPQELDSSEPRFWVIDGQRMTAIFVDSGLLQEECEKEFERKVKGRGGFASIFE